MKQIRMRLDFRLFNLMHIMNRLYFVFSILFLVSISCSKKEKKPPFVPPQNAVALLTNDSTKTWKFARRYNGQTRMNMEGCFLKYLQTFKADNTVSDNNNQNANCGSSLNGNWKIRSKDNGFYYLQVYDEAVSDLLNQESDTIDFKLLYLDRDSLAVSFYHNQFGTKRLITDYLVEEHIEIENRNFHWK